MNRIKTLSIAKKEYYHLLRDPRSLYLAFMIPLFLILLFGYALSLDVEDVRTVVVDLDRSALSRDLLTRLDASAYFAIVGHVATVRELAGLLDQGWATMGLVIPPDWAENMQADRDGPIQVLFDGSDPNYAGIARAYITAFFETFNRERLIEFLNRNGMERIEPPVEGQIRVWFNEDLESRNFILPGIIAIIIMIVGAILTSLVIAREYENGTMETIRSLPIGTVEFIMGKAIPYFFIALTDVLIAMLMGQVLFGIVMKSSVWLMLLASAVYLEVALGLGLLISIVTRSQLVANQMAILVTYLPSLLLSDFVFPVSNMPKILQKITYLIPATYYIDILNGLYLKKLGMAELWSNYLVLGGMWVFVSVMSIAVLKRQGV